MPRSSPPPLTRPLRSRDADTLPCRPIRTPPFPYPPAPRARGDSKRSTSTLFNNRSTSSRSTNKLPIPHSRNPVIRDLLPGIPTFPFHRPLSHLYLYDRLQSEPCVITRRQTHTVGHSHKPAMSRISVPISRVQMHCGSTLASHLLDRAEPRQ